MQTPLPVLGYGISGPTPRSQRKDASILVLILLTWIVFVCGFNPVKEWIDDRRKDRQVTQVKAILAQNPDRFRKVYISRSSAPDLHVDGYVRTDKDLSQLREEMSKQLGRELGRTVNLWVQVVPPGTIRQGETQDFWGK